MCSRARDKFTSAREGLATRIKLSADLYCIYVEARADGSVQLSYPVLVG